MSKELIKACKKGNVTDAELLISNGANVNYQYAGGFTALMEACLNKKYETVKLLMNNGARPDLQTSGAGQTALMMTNGNIAITELLINNKANLDIQCDLGYTALISSCESGRVDFVKLLIEKGAQIHIQNNNSRTALISAACRIENLEIVKLLIDKGAQINHQDKNGNTPLIESARCGNIDIAKYLIDKGANIDLQNSTGETALSINGKLRAIYERNELNKEILAMTNQEEISIEMFGTAAPTTVEAPLKLSQKEQGHAILMSIVDGDPEPEPVPESKFSTNFDKRLAEHDHRKMQEQDRVLGL